MVGPYRMLTRLGEGGMGVVHLGQAADGRRLAVKVLRPHVVGDDEARDRLAREVNSLSRVKSPRVAEIIDADPYGPIPYVATRYVPGLSLTDHVKQEGAITGADLAWFARALAEALDAVHAAGVLHRDIKPSNVLMEGRTPILIDFGLAKVADDVRLTRTGWLLGTPGYIAPETLHGEDPTTAADVHGWAATVAFAGTGRAPFGRGPSMAIMDRVRRGQHDLGGLDPRLLPLVSRGLDPDPSRRPRMGEVLHALGAVPATPRAPIDDVPLTQPHDLESLLWATQRVDEPATRAFEEPATRRQEEPPTRGYDEDPTAYDDPPPNRQPYQTPPPADWASPSQQPTAARPVRRRLDPRRLGGPAAARVRRRAVPPGAARPHRDRRGRRRGGRRAVPHRDRARRARGAAPRHVADRRARLRPARPARHQVVRRGADAADRALVPARLAARDVPAAGLGRRPRGLRRRWCSSRSASGSAGDCSRSARSPRWCCGPVRAPHGCGRRCAGSAHPLARSGRSWAVSTACLLALLVGGAFLLDARGIDWSPYQGAPDVAGSRFAPFL